MHIDLKQTVSQFTEFVRSKPICKIIINPITLAMCLTAVMMIIIVFTYDRNHLIRTGFRIFVVSLGLIFLNNHFLIQDIRKQSISDSEENLMKIIEGGEVDDDILAYQPLNSEDL